MLSVSLHLHFVSSRSWIMLTVKFNVHGKNVKKIDNKNKTGN